MSPRLWFVQRALWASLLGGATGCLASVAEYDPHGNFNVSYGVGFYEPYDVEYGRWPTGYRVGPPRGRVGHEAHQPRASVTIQPPRPAYRVAPPSRPMPALPPRPGPRRR